MERVLNSRRKTFYSCPLYMNVSKVPRGRIWEGTHATLAGVDLQDILAAQSEIEPLVVLLKFTRARISCFTRN